MLLCVQELLGIIMCEQLADNGQDLANIQSLTSKALQYPVSKVDKHAMLKQLCHLGVPNWVGVKEAKVRGTHTYLG